MIQTKYLRILLLKEIKINPRPFRSPFGHLYLIHMSCLRVLSLFPVFNEVHIALLALAFSLFYFWVI